MATRILVRAPGQPDRVLTLLPRHYERFAFEQRGGQDVTPPHISIMLLEDATGITHDPAMHIDEQTPPVVEQFGLGDLTGGGS